TPSLGPGEIVREDKRGSEQMPVGMLTPNERQWNVGQVSLAIPERLPILKKTTHPGWWGRGVPHDSPAKGLGHRQRGGEGQARATSLGQNQQFAVKVRVRGW